MRLKTWVFAGAVAALLFCGVVPSASARQNNKPPHLKLKVKKNSNQFGGNYMAPRKQKPPTGYYRDSLTGHMVYGQPPAK